MTTKTSRESGQILIIFTVALVALLAFTALVIDGGMIFADRRYEQSVADNASLAGAGAAAQYLDDNGILWTDFDCYNEVVVESFNVAYNAALERAISNGVADLDNDLSDNHGIEITCFNDPGHFEKYIDVHTMITSTVTTSFLQVIYPNPVHNTVNAVVRIHPRTELAFGHAIVSMSDDCGTNRGGIDFNGGSYVHINGGGIFSNSCLDGNGHPIVDVDNGGIRYVTDDNLSDNGTVSPSPVQSDVKMPVQQVPPPACGDEASMSSTGGGTISPGNYSRIKLTNGSLTMNPGLYCLTGDFSIQGGVINADGVTIYMMKDGGSSTAMTINGNAEAHLSAAFPGYEVNNAIAGILVYMAEDNHGTIDLAGTSGSSFMGTIYAPNADISIGGTTGVNPTYNTQLIGKYVKVHGTSDTDINYNATPPFTVEPKLDLME